MLLLIFVLGQHVGSFVTRMTVKDMFKRNLKKYLIYYVLD